MIDTVKVTEADRDWGTGETDWDPIYGSFPLKKDSFQTVYFWAEIMRESGSGTVQVRLHLTDGVDDYYSDSKSSSSASWEAVGPASINISALADKSWDCYVQGKAEAGAVMRGQKFVVRRET